MFRAKTIVTVITAFLVLIPWNLLIAQDLAAQARPRSPRADQAIRVKPQELGAYLHGKKVTAMLGDGSWLEGKVGEATADKIAIDVKKASSPRFKKGKQDIAIQEFASFAWKQTKSRLGRTVLTPTLAVVGAFFGTLAGATTSDDFDDLGHAGAGMGLGLSAGIVGGYLIGRAIDSKETILMVEK